MRLSANVAERPCLAAVRPLLGTLVAIEIVDPGSAAASALEAAFAAVQAVDERMSFHRAESELSCINRQAAFDAVLLSTPMHRVLRAALALARASDGVFDPSIGGQLVAWGQLPAPHAPAPDPEASWRDIELGREGRLRFRRPLWIDLGGIAKGFAVDQAIAALRRAGVRAATVNAGGDLRSFGHEHAVWVRDPAQPQRPLPLLYACNIAVASSSGYFSRLRGRSALVDTARRRSRGLRDAVTVCAPRALWADALTKIALIDARRARPLLQRLRASAVVLHRDGSRSEVA